jgi:hypothetical protein
LHNTKERHPNRRCGADKLGCKEEPTATEQAVIQREHITDPREDTVEADIHQEDTKGLQRRMDRYMDTEAEAILEGVEEYHPDME